jgi:hypothetical protein
VTDRRVVLVVSGQDDHTPDLIIPALGARGADVVRLDPSATPLAIACHTGPGGAWTGTITAGQGRTVHVQDVGAVLFRWPPPPPGNPVIGDDLHRLWAAREDAQALHGILKSLKDVRWMNEPDAVIGSASKPMQLVDAARVGLPVPATLITTGGPAAAKWAAEVGGRDVLYKAFHAEFAGTLSPARAVDPADLPADLLSAGICQQVVDGVPVRTTVVGDSIFSATVERGFTGLDWRLSQGSVGISPAATPTVVADAIHALMAEWGLTYGAFDFMIDDSGTWWFLECNPAGQYGLVEARAGLPVTAAIADWLTGP